MSIPLQFWRQDMLIVEKIQNIISAGTDQLAFWLTKTLPAVFLFLIFLNAVTRIVGRARVERLAARSGSNPLLRYLVLPFLSSIILGNPMAISMGRYLPERYKPAYFASVSYHCHTNSGIFQHINPAELFLWIGIVSGVSALGLDVFPLALRYMCAGLCANFISGYATEIITGKLEKEKNIRLSDVLELQDDAPEHFDDAPEHSEDKPHPYHSITITCGDGGYGGPVTVTPTEKCHTVLYMTAGGSEPEPLAKILELSGMTPVNGNLDVCPDEKVALAIIDCGGTLRCGIYPGKGIPTVNLLATGRSGPLAKYMTPDKYVSAVTSADISLTEVVPMDEIAPSPISRNETSHGMSDQITEIQKNEQGSDFPALNPIFEPVAVVSRVVNIFYQSARDAVSTCLEMLLPFMGFAALFIGIFRGSGLTMFLAGLMRPIEGSLPGLFIIGILCSIPGLSAILGAGAVAAQMFATVIGDLIAAGSFAPALALPALFAINCQCACDFIPVGLGMMEAKSETTQLGITAVTLSRFATGWLRILIALIFSIGLYS